MSYLLVEWSLIRWLLLDTSLCACLSFLSNESLSPTGSSMSFFGLGAPGMWLLVVTRQAGPLFSGEVLGQDEEANEDEESEHFDEEEDQRRGRAGAEQASGSAIAINESNYYFPKKTINGSHYFVNTLCCLNCEISSTIDLERQRETNPLL